MKSKLIAVMGVSGGGKSTLCQNLVSSDQSIGIIRVENLDYSDKDIARLETIFGGDLTRGGTDKRLHMFRMAKLCPDSIKPWEESQEIFAPLVQREIQRMAELGNDKFILDCYAMPAMPDIYKTTDLQYQVNPVDEHQRLHNQMLREFPRHPEMSHSKIEQMCRFAGDVSDTIMRLGLVKNNFNPIRLHNDYTEKSLQQNVDIIKSEIDIII